MEQNQELIELNVGGVGCTTTFTTLTSPDAEGSMLARLVILHAASRRSSTPATTDGSSLCPMDISNIGSNASGSTVRLPACLSDARLAGALFIDRDGSMFRHVLSFLRACAQFVPPADLQSSQQLMQEARYYHLEALVGLLQVHEEALLKKHEAELMALHRIAAQAEASNSKLTNINDTLSALRSYLLPGVLRSVTHESRMRWNNPEHFSQLLADLQEFM